VRHPLFDRHKITGAVRFGKSGNSAGGTPHGLNWTHAEQLNRAPLEFLWEGKITREGMFKSVVVLPIGNVGW
jgi:hypothetical protein